MRILKFTALLSVIALASCASIIGSSTQEVEVITPGIIGADCRFENENYAYNVYTPDVVTFERSYLPMTATCKATGYQTEIVEIPVMMNPNSKLNVMNAGVGMLYDAGARTLPAYPDRLIIDMVPEVAETVVPVYQPVEVVPQSPYPADMTAEQILRGVKMPK